MWTIIVIVVAILLIGPIIGLISKRIAERKMNRHN